MKEIKLTQGKVALVDDQDYEWLSQFKWCAKYVNKSKRYDAVRRNPEDGRNIFMHRFIMGLTLGDGLVVDHRNHNTLDYQRSNLRVCTQAENCKNSSARKNSTSKFLGVSAAKRGQYTYWRSCIQHGDKLVSLGYSEFSSEGEILAAKAYNEAAKKYYGEFANLNAV